MFDKYTIGTLNLAPTSADHIHVEGEVTIRGKTLHTSAHFYLHGDGQWRLAPQGERASNQFYPTEATPAFRAKYVETVTPVINQWANENPQAMRKANDDHRQQAIQNRREQIARHQKAIDQLTEEITRIEAGENLLKHSDIKSYYP